MPTEPGPLARAEVQTLDAYWRATSYLTAGQIYLLANPLLAKPLRPEHIRPRLLGHGAPLGSQALACVHRGPRRGPGVQRQSATARRPPPSRPRRLPHRRPLIALARLAACRAAVAVEVGPPRPGGLVFAAPPPTASPARDLGGPGNRAF